ADATRTDIHGGETTSIIVNASYYFGGRVPIQRMREADDCVAVDYRPPGLDPSFSVAPRQDYGYAYGRGYRPTISRSLGPEAKTGRLEYDISLSTGSNGQTQRCTHSVAVSDISDKQIGAETNIWVHPQFYLAAHSPRSLHEGEAAEIAIQTLDFDGKPLAVADIEVTLERSWYEPEYVTEDGKRRYVGEQSRKETLKPCKTKSDGSAACSFAKLGQGYYEIRVAAKQGEYVTIATHWLWVSPKGGAWSWSRTPVSKLTISVDQPKPIPGQTIHARVQAPWNTGTGLVMLSKGGLHELRTFTLSKGAAELDFEVTDAW